MTEINTFSAAVDEAVARAKRPDRKADALAYVRASIRECTLRKFFKRDFVEDQIIATGEPHIWTFPAEFRLLQTVRYQIYNNRGQFLYPKEKMPGKAQREEDYYYYGASTYYVFAGVDAGVYIDVGYYQQLKQLAYYEVAARPATYSLETQSWTYLTAATPAEEEAARDLVTNWVLFNYYDTIVEGALAKIFKTVGDPRSSSSFALYKSYQNDLVAAEPSATLNL